jgi:hypothetical protein
VLSIQIGTIAVTTQNSEQDYAAEYSFPPTLRSGTSLYQPGIHFSQGRPTRSPTLLAAQTKTSLVVADVTSPWRDWRQRGRS